MNGFTIITAILALLTAGFTPSMRADDSNKETHLTINQPLQVQNTLLAPGQFVFPLIEPNVVSIYMLTALDRRGSLWVGRRTGSTPATRKRLQSCNPKGANQ